MSPRSAQRALVACIVLVALALAGAACGDDDDTGAEPSGAEPAAEAPAGDEGEAGDSAGSADAGDSPFARDACELLTDADVREIFGERVEGSFTEGHAGSSTPGQCEWASGEVGDPGDPGLGGLVLFLGDEGIFENTRVLAEGSDMYETLDGIGDDAYAGSADGGVLIGEAGITVTPIGINTNDPATHDLIVDVLERAAANY